ncbi:MAG TPA: SPFH domain-containing protein, partial [Planctomycetaceae bacterium]|nr:SPFH domain-containing protein [Planctomycetaceae bacterium]
EHENDEESVAAESLILTGDEVAVELTAELQYRISELRAWFLNQAVPEETLRAIAESVIRETAARESLDDLLTDRRREIEAAGLTEIRRRSSSLGVEILGLNLLDIHPPRPVVPAYREVADALEEQQQLVNSAEEYYMRTVLSATGEEVLEVLQQGANRSVRNLDWTLTDEAWSRLGQRHDRLSGQIGASLMQAEADAEKTRTSARASSDRFRSLLQEYESSPELTQWHLYWKTIESVLAARPLTIVDPEAAGRQQLFLNGTANPLPILRSTLPPPEDLENEPF